MMEYLKNNWISILALIISIIALMRDLINDLIKKHEQRNENKKAIITAKIINNQLIISNRGKASARNIQILIDDKAINQSIFSAYSTQKDFSLLTCNNSIGIKYVDGLDKKRNYKIKVIWEDDFAKNNYIEDVINL